MCCFDLEKVVKIHNITEENAIVAHRHMVVRDEYLLSPIRGTPWPSVNGFPQLTASAPRTRFRKRAKVAWGTQPGKRGTTEHGIYARKMAWARGACAVVRLWGRVVEFQTGYMAEHAKIVSINANLCGLSSLVRQHFVQTHYPNLKITSREMEADAILSVAKIPPRFTATKNHKKVVV